ncbi:Tubulin Hypothetical protein cofactor C [Nesidiocoris tenuis]|uniref:C-CAP/cofactor C-like domain-containing protein n=1 Tax=Nesidiocoris tenuis TaxID=355587 RepID=A0ABN7BH67_9HEMI|nr:Tubulin Hypothetical protein cofactor C [Nesidiocoris tenuis]
MIQPTEAALLRKEKRDDESPSQAELFRETFKEKQAEIEDSLSAIDGSSDRLKLADDFDRVSRKINDLNRYLASSSIFLTAYNMKICKHQLQTLSDRLSEMEAELLPRKKFAFRKREATKKAEAKAERQAVVVDKPLSTDAYVVEDRRSETVVVDSIADKDVTLSRLVDCTVFIHGSPNTLHLIDLTSCKIVSGPVVTSVLVENCADSAFAFPCQQLRVHGCRRDDFHVRVSTRAIIEDTTAVRFGPCRRAFGDDTDGPADPVPVDDFNWLVNNKQSPNWTTLPDQDQIAFWNSLDLNSAQASR